jgi:phosphocarrier protein
MGIHARPAAMIVRIANQFHDVDLRVSKDEEEVNGKSIMGLMMLAAGHQSKLQFVASGNPTKVGQMLDKMEDLFARRFDETN